MSVVEGTSNVAACSYRLGAYRNQKIEAVGRSPRDHDEEHSLHVVVFGRFCLHQFKQSNCSHLSNSSE